MDEENRQRPETAERLVGQPAAEAFLATAWSSGKLAHGWLLTGSEGIGKATLAFRFAKAILASGGVPAPLAEALPGFDAPVTLPVIDINHPVVRLITAHAHPNLKVIRRSMHPKTGKLRSEITVDDVRKALKFLHNTAVDGGWRVVIVDPVDDMNRNAANALLKALEEPPKRCLFLLINHVPGTVLPTIRSRCQVLQMPSLSEPDTRSVVEALAPEAEPTSLDAVVSLADGSPGRALGLLDADAPGLDRQLAAILQSAEAGGTAKALDLAEQVSRPNATVAFRTTGQLLARRLVQQSKEAATPQAREAAARLWFDLAARFRETEHLNLDRRHAVMRACLDTREIVARRQ